MRSTDSISQLASNNCGTPLPERRYPAFRNGGFTAQEYSVDWAGTTFSYYDADDNKEQKCYLLVATLQFSMFCYAEAFTNMNMKQEAWINAHVRMYA